MSSEDMRELWARFLGGERLSQDEKRRILAALEQDEALRQELLKDLHAEGWMRALALRRKSAEAFIEGVRTSLNATKDSTGFIKKVESRLAGESTSGLGGGTPPSQESSRRPTRGWRRPAADSAGWNFGLVAAGLVLGFVAILAWISSDSNERSATRTARQRPKAAAPKPPAEERVSSEAERKAAEARLAEADRRLREAEEARKKAESDKDKDLKRKADEEFRTIVEERKGLEENLKAAREREEAAKKEPAPPAPSPAPREKPPAAPTEAAVAKVGRVEGEAYLVVRGEKKPAVTGLDIVAGQGLETGEANSFVEISYPDQSRLEMAAGTVVRELKSEGGKRLTVEKGALRAEVKKQPKDQPMVVETPQGEATVVGTILKIMVDPDPKKGTRLEVEEGKIQFKNKLIGKTVDVLSGQYAVAAVGMELAAKPLYQFRDDFESTQVRWLFPTPNPWHLVADPDGRGKVLAGGSWVGATVEQRTRAALQCGDPAWTDYAVEASVRFEAFDKGRLDGVIVLARLQDLQNYYMLEYTHDGLFQIAKVSKGQFLGLSVKTVPPAPRGRWYRLRFELDGTQLRGFLDGKLMAEASDADFRSGRVAFMRSTPSSVSHVILWDDVAIKPLSAGR